MWRRCEMHTLSNYKGNSGEIQNLANIANFTNIALYLRLWIWSNIGRSCKLQRTLEHIKYSSSLENMQKTPAIAYCVCNCKQNCTQCVCLYNGAFEYVFYVLVLIPHKLMGSKPNGRSIQNVVCYESWHAHLRMHLDFYFVVKSNVKHIVLYFLWNFVFCNSICGLLLFPPIRHFHFKKFWNSKQ